MDEMAEYKINTEGKVLRMFWWLSHIVVYNIRTEISIVDSCTPGF